MASKNIPDPSPLVHVPTGALHNQPGVYALYCKGEMVYVGKATNMKRRIGYHMYEAVKTFDAVSVIPCSVAAMDAVEAEMIRDYRPKYNNCAIAKTARVEAAFTRRDPSKPIELIEITLSDLVELTAA